VPVFGLETAISMRNLRPYRRVPDWRDYLTYAND